MPVEHVIVSVKWSPVRQLVPLEHGNLSSPTPDTQGRAPPRPVEC